MNQTEKSARTYAIKNYVLEDFKRGNQQAFNKIFRDLYPALCYYGFQITGDRFSAQDIAEEAFIKVWERRHLFNQFNVLKAYLYTIVKNDSINWLKAETRRRVSEDTGAGLLHNNEPLAWEKLVKTELIHELHSIIKKLPPQRQKVMTMLYQEGKSVKQAAEELKVSLTAVKLHKKAGLQFLQKLMPLKALLFILMVC